MSINGIGDEDSFGYFDVFNFDNSSEFSINEWRITSNTSEKKIPEWRGRNINVLKQQCLPSFIQFGTAQKDLLSLSNRTIEHTMMKVSVRKKGKDGKEVEGSIEIDTRKPEKSKNEDKKNLN